VSSKYIEYYQKIRNETFCGEVFFRNNEIYNSHNETIMLDIPVLEFVLGDYCHVFEFLQTGLELVIGIIGLWELPTEQFYFICWSYRDLSASQLLL
jgi:hypothetical protein